MGEKKTEEKINDALLKVALGYQVAEVTEEYAEVDGELKLTKRKKTKKDVPPDLKAVQMLLAAEGDETYAQWSDEELEEEKRRLIASLQENQMKTTVAQTEEEDAKSVEKRGKTGQKKTTTKSKGRERTAEKRTRRKSVRKTVKK